MFYSDRNVSQNRPVQPFGGGIKPVQSDMTYYSFVKD